MPTGRKKSRKHTQIWCNLHVFYQHAAQETYVNHFFDILKFLSIFTLYGFRILGQCNFNYMRSVIYKLVLFSRHYFNLLTTIP